MTFVEGVIAGVFVFLVASYLASRVTRLKWALLLGMVLGLIAFVALNSLVTGPIGYGF